MFFNFCIAGKKSYITVHAYKGISHRFELFVAGKEICNGYTELNDSVEQALRFQKQTADKAFGDSEAQTMDSGFVRALEYGLPPTVGWGLGMDRLCMLLVNSQRIREVIPFPLSKGS